MPRARKRTPTAETLIRKSLRTNKVAKARYDSDTASDLADLCMNRNDDPDKTVYYGQTGERAWVVILTDRPIN